MVAPSNPELTVREFLSAVRDNSLVAMADLWGTSGGPASAKMDPEELRKRLTIIQIYLDHESYEIIPDAGTPLPGSGAERELRVQLTRQGCTPVVPFTLVRWGEGWLVANIDLTAVGNPARACQPEGTR